MRLDQLPDSTLPSGFADAPGVPCVELSAAKALTPPELVEQVFAWVHRLAHRAARVHGLDVEDLSQEIFLHILRYGRSFNPERSAPTTWTAYAARSVILTLLRRRERQRSRLPFASLDAVLDLGFDQGCPRTSEPSTIATEREEHDQVEELHEALSALPERLRFVILGRFGIDGERRTLASLGEELGLTRERVRQLQEEGLDRIGDVLDPKG